MAFDEHNSSVGQNHVVVGSDGWMVACDSVLGEPIKGVGSPLLPQDRASIK